MSGNKQVEVNIAGQVYRFAIAPEEAQGRLIYFTQNVPAGYPPLGSRLGEPAEFPAVASA